MAFHSLAFLAFLSIIYLVYWRFSRRMQNVLLLVGSYVFYGWWDWRFLSLISISSVLDYWAGLRVATEEGRGRRRAWLAVSLVGNLGLLFVFKYLEFGVHSLVLLLGSMGIEADLRVMNVILPVGISFYTFQTMSYTIDVYRRRMEPTRDAVAFLAFVAFFPQLVAGPIERASNLLPQFLRDRAFVAGRATDGLRQMLYGYFLKVLVADNLAMVVDPTYADPSANGWRLLAATYFFAIQIYCDFAGYSHVAIGCARLFGFDLMRNFAYPYFSRSPAEFWHRWHVSLSTWFRDYVYIPLGGSRGGPVRRRVNVLITFVISGLWHGAGFTYLAWGFIHGVLVALQWWNPGTRIEKPCEGRWLPRPRDAMAMLLTFHMVGLAWVFFRARDLAHAIGIIHRMAHDLLAVSAAEGLRDIPARYFLMVPMVLLIEWMQRNRSHGLDVARWPGFVRWTVYLGISTVILLKGRIESVPFIYFQF
ncbi:MAG: MBOAT family protein [Planctomycetes bacterium]|nr:MBOAT family protein [Planctomycetota bacterium]